MGKVQGNDRTWDQLTPKEQKYILRYVETGNGTQSAIDAGYANDKKTAQYESKQLKLKPYIKAHIKQKLEEMHSPMIADGKEVMEYLTKVMRGEIKDAFGLDVAIADRTKAAIELAKRTVDIENEDKKDKNIAITLLWE